MNEAASGLPLRQTWLDAIVDVLIFRPDGIADVDTLANEIMKTDRDTGSNPKETITRRINDYCGDASDYQKQPKHNLFERVGPATYRLRGWPIRPDLLNIQQINFVDAAYSLCFEKFREIAEAKNPERFQKMTNRERLVAFANNIKPGAPLHSTLQAYKQSLEIDLD